MKWEYQFKYLLNDSCMAINETIRDIDNHNAKLLDDMGMDGWELVSVDNGIAYFKKEVPLTSMSLREFIDKYNPAPIKIEYKP